MFKSAKATIALSGDGVEQTFVVQAALRDGDGVGDKLKLVVDKYMEGLAKVCGPSDEMTHLEDALTASENECHALKARVAELEEKLAGKPRRGRTKGKAE